jgi:hypothetical protein
MKKTARCLGLVLCGGLLWFPPSALASALDDLTDAAGQGLPNVPMPSEPTRVDDPNDRQSNQDAQNDEAQRQEQLRQQQAEQQRQEQAEQARQEELRRQQEEQKRQEQLRQLRAEQERQARVERERQEALRRQREEQERLEKLRRETAAVEARASWATQDEKNSNAFDDVFAATSGPDTFRDSPNSVGLTDASAILSRGGSKGALRIKPPPLPKPDFVLVASREDPESAETPRWHIDWDGRLKDLRFAYISMYLKSKIEGLASIPEMLKDSLDLKKKLNTHVSDYLKRLFSVAGESTDPNADDAALAEKAWNNFHTAAANIDEDARDGIRNNLGTTSGGALPEDSPAAAGIGIGQQQLQDTAERKKWGESDAHGDP